MQITINGKINNIQAANIADLIAELALNSRQVAIERNQEIVPKSAYKATMLAAGDIIEIVAFVGGG